MHKIIGGTDKGRMRVSNQDAFAGRALEEGCAYLLVCDGLGGENGGEVASALACQEITRVLVESAFVTANAVIRRRAREDLSLAGMCTTAVAAVALGGEITLCHVGDSRAYRLQGEEAVALTTDHTLVQMLIDEGKITEDEAADRPDRHHITRAVGAEDYLDVELGSCTLQPGETLLLCSDGLYNMVDKGEYPALARRCLEEGSAAPFLERANQLGGADNITVLLLYGG